MRIFYDTEFTTLQADQDAYLISAGFVTEDGEHEFYAEISDFPREQCSGFVRATVLPLLYAPGAKRYSEKMFALLLVEWLSGFGESVELFSDSPTDWYILCDVLRDAKSDLPFPLRGVVAAASGVSAAEAEYRFWQQPENKGKRHHAMFDARCLREARLALERNSVA